jgi:hypothetical protein
MPRKLYRQCVASKWEIIEKETVDEIIFRTNKIQNRLLLELMARGDMRIGEVLKLKAEGPPGSQTDSGEAQERPGARNRVHCPEGGRQAS